MRYYAVLIEGAPADVFPPVAGAEILGQIAGEAQLAASAYGLTALAPGAQWCSVVNGMNDPGCQHVEFDINEYTAGEGTNSCTVTVHNPTLAQLQVDLTNLYASVYGGMYKGLPLATDHYQRGLTGLLMRGLIDKCWGSWNGTEMYLAFSFVPTGIGETGVTSPDPNASQPSTSGSPLAAPSTQMVMYGPRSLANLPTATPTDLAGIVGGLAGGLGGVSGIVSQLFGGGGTIENPLNLIHNMMPNMPLSGAIMQTLNQAFPGGNINMFLKGGMALPTQDAGMYQSLPQYAAYINQLSRSIKNVSGYTGVHMSTHGVGLNIWDMFSPVK